MWFLISNTLSSAHFLTIKTIHFSYLLCLLTIYKSFQSGINLLFPFWPKFVSKGLKSRIFSSFPENLHQNIDFLLLCRNMALLHKQSELRRSEIAQSIHRNFIICSEWCHLAKLCFHFFELLMAIKIFFEQLNENELGFLLRSTETQLFVVLRKPYERSELFFEIFKCHLPLEIPSQPSDQPPHLLIIHAYSTSL